MADKQPRTGLQEAIRSHDAGHRDIHQGQEGLFFQYARRQYAPWSSAPCQHVRCHVL